MVDYEAPVYDEGSLARRWEERIRVEPDVLQPGRRRKARHLKPIAGTVYWLGMLWLAALFVTFAAVHVMQMGYRIDALQTQYTGLVRQEQGLKAQVATLSSPLNLERDANRLKVSFRVPKTLSVAVRRPVRSRAAFSLTATVRRDFRSLREALTGR